MKEYCYWCELELAWELENDVMLDGALRAWCRRCAVDALSRIRKPEPRPLREGERCPSTTGAADHRAEGAGSIQCSLPIGHAPPHHHAGYLCDWEDAPPPPELAELRAQLERDVAKERDRQAEEEARARRLERERRRELELEAAARSASSPPTPPAPPARETDAKPSEEGSATRFSLLEVD